MYISSTSSTSEQATTMTIILLLLAAQSAAVRHRGTALEKWLNLMLDLVKSSPWAIKSFISRYRRTFSLPFHHLLHWWQVLFDGVPPGHFSILWRSTVIWAFIIGLKNAKMVHQFTSFLAFFMSPLCFYCWMIIFKIL